MSEEYHCGFAYVTRAKIRQAAQLTAPEKYIGKIVIRCHPRVANFIEWELDLPSLAEVHHDSAFAINVLEIETYNGKCMMTHFVLDDDF
jgi:hypothetical protein